MKSAAGDSGTDTSAWTDAGGAWTDCGVETSETDLGMETPTLEEDSSDNNDSNDRGEQIRPGSTPGQISLCRDNDVIGGGEGSAWDSDQTGDFTTRNMLTITDKCLRQFPNTTTTSSSSTCNAAVGGVDEDVDGEKRMFQQRRRSNFKTKSQTQETLNLKVCRSLFTIIVIF